MGFVVRQFFRFCFFLTGWKTIGKLPEVKKYILIVAPHTSNMDFFVGLAARHILNFKSHYLAKKSLFDNPFVGWFLRLTGGYPVDRSRKMKMTDQVVELYNQHEEFVVTITPEGTRSYVPEWKTGFYRIAVNAGLPILLVGFDYSRKVVELKELFYPTDDMGKDMEHILSYYRTIKGRHPEKGVK